MSREDRSDESKAMNHNGKRKICKTYILPTFSPGIRVWLTETFCPSGLFQSVLLGWVRPACNLYWVLCLLVV